MEVALAFGDRNGLNCVFMVSHYHYAKIIYLFFGLNIHYPAFSLYILVDQLFIFIFFLKLRTNPTRFLFKPLDFTNLELPRSSLFDLFAAKNSNGFLLIESLR